MINPTGKILTLAACLVLLPSMAAAESNSSRLNKERLEIGRALLEVTADNVDPSFLTMQMTSNTMIRSSTSTASGR
jgi:hypothetical protein